MAGQLKFTGTMEDTDPLGAKDPLTTTFTVAYSNKVEINASLSTTSPTVVWDPANASSPVTAAVAIWGVASGTLSMELGATSSSTATDGAVFMAIPLAANAQFFIGSAVSYTPSISNAALHATMSATVIDSVKLVNPTTTAVNIKMIVAG